MKTRYLTLFIALFSISVFAQDVNMQNGTITQCSGNLFDSGGPSANYGNVKIALPQIWMSISLHVCAGIALMSSRNTTTDTMF